MNTDARFCCHCGKPLAPSAQYTQAPWNAFASHLVRPREGRMIAGVCAGIAARYGWDPSLVRIVTVVMFCLGVVVVPLVYVAAWIIMPNAPLLYVAPATPQGFSGSATGSVTGA